MANWSISYTDVFGKKKVESFTSQGAAQARYEELIPRTYGDLGDLVNVTAPIRSAVKVSEGIFYGSADKKDPNRYADGKEEWGDFKDVVRKLLAEFDDRAETKFFKVVPIGNDNYEIYFKGDGDKLSDLLFMSIYQSAMGEPTFNVIKGDVSDAVFDDAYDIVEPYIADVFRMAYDDGNTGIVRKFYSSDDFHKSLKEDCGGASAASLGAVPTATVRPSNKRESVFDDDELERTGDQAPWGKMNARDRKALQDALKVAQKYRPDATIDPKKKCIVFKTDEGPSGSVSISTETYTGFGGSSDIHTRYDVRHKAWASYDTFSTEDLADLDIILKGINAGVFKYTNTWDEFVRNVRRATRKKRSV